MNAEKLSAYQRAARAYKSDYSKKFEAGNIAECLAQADKWKRLINEGSRARALAPSPNTLIRHLITALKKLQDCK